MLPSEQWLNLEYIDDRIRNIVVNLNRIPGVDTYTTCEGHIWAHNTSYCPTKCGWIHFVAPEGHDIHDIIRGFCDTHEYFTLFERKDGPEPRYSTLNALHYPHENGELIPANIAHGYPNMTREEKARFIRNARARRAELYKGWEDLDRLLAGYLREKYGDYESLPYRESSDGREIV